MDKAVMDKDIKMFLSLILLALFALVIPICIAAV